MSSENLLGIPSPRSCPPDPAADRAGPGRGRRTWWPRHTRRPRWPGPSWPRTRWTEGRTIESYAYARVGYHRGLDALRNGWRGQGPVPWEHEPNRGFLRALAALAGPPGRSARRAEEQRCADVPA